MAIKRTLMTASLPKICFLLLLLSCSLSWAITLGRMVIADRYLGSRPIIYEKINQLAIVEGDIIIAKIADLHRMRALIKHTIGGDRWPGGLVPFEIAKNLPFTSKLAVLQAIAHWQDKTNIRFVKLTPENRRHYRDYIVFVFDEGTTCASYVGKHGGRQEIILSTRCTSLMMAHEIGHGIGFYHEHSREDRDNFVTILWENIQEEHKYNFNQHITDGRDVGPYDYKSLMHYGSHAFSINGRETIRSLNGEPIGQRKTLSEQDIAAVNEMYPKT